MGKPIIGGVLLTIAAFMLLGFVSGGFTLTATTIAALLISVGIPAAGGAYLIRQHFGGERRLESRREALRIDTMLAEVLRMAGRHDGRLTVVEVAGELAVRPEEAKALLDELMARELADIEITEDGLLVYRFSDVQQLADKAEARGLLE